MTHHTPPAVPAAAAPATGQTTSQIASQTTTQARVEDLTQATAFERLGGEAGTRALVDRFYDLMDLEPAYARLREVHGSTLDDARDKLFWFLCGWLGGPNHYIERFGHPRLRARHLPFSIGSVERDQWLACMFQAMDEQQVEPALRERLEKSLFDTADWMRNRAD